MKERQNPVMNENYVVCFIKIYKKQKLHNLPEPYNITFEEYF